MKSNEKLIAACSRMEMEIEALITSAEQHGLSAVAAHLSMAKDALAHYLAESTDSESIDWESEA